MIAFNPLAFAVRNAASTDGTLFIQTCNGGSASRYRDELGALGDSIIEALADGDIAIIPDAKLEEAKFILDAIVDEDPNNSSCLSLAAIFIRSNGQIATTWFSGQDGEWMSKEQIEFHATL